MPATSNQNHSCRVLLPRTNIGYVLRVKTSWLFAKINTSQNEDGHVGRVQVEAHDHQIAYQFIAARPWAIRDCIDFVKTLKNLVRGTSHACISASYIDKEKKNQRGQMERIGIFNRIKTDKGCEGKECVFTEKIRQEYCPDLK